MLMAAKIVMQVYLPVLGAQPWGVICCKATSCKVAEALIYEIAYEKDVVASLRIALNQRKQRWCASASDPSHRSLPQQPPFLFLDFLFNEECAVENFCGKSPSCPNLPSRLVAVQFISGLFESLGLGGWVQPSHLISCHSHPADWTAALLCHIIEKASVAIRIP